MVGFCRCLWPGRDDAVLLLPDELGAGSLTVAPLDAAEEFRVQRSSPRRAEAESRFCPARLYFCRQVQHGCQLRADAVREARARCMPTAALSRAAVSSLILAPIDHGGSSCPWRKDGGNAACACGPRAAPQARRRRGEKYGQPGLWRSFASWMVWPLAFVAYRKGPNRSEALPWHITWNDRVRPN